LSFFFRDSLPLSHKFAVMFYAAMEAFHDRVSNFEQLCSLIIHNNFSASRALDHDQALPIRNRVRYWIC